MLNAGATLMFNLGIDDTGASLGVVSLSFDGKSFCVGVCLRDVNTNTDKLVTSIPMIDKMATCDNFMRAMFSHQICLESKSRAGSTL